MRFVSIIRADRLGLPSSQRRHALMSFVDLLSQQNDAQRAASVIISHVAIVRTERPKTAAAKGRRRR